MEEMLPAERCDQQQRDKAAAGQVGAALGAVCGCWWGMAGAVLTLLCWGLVLRCGAGDTGLWHSTLGPSSCLHHLPYGGPGDSA